jgi:hypothetical protein
VKDFAIEQLADADYSVFVSADENITAAVRMARSAKAKKPNTDFTWLQAGETFVGERSMTVAATGISKLSIANPNDKTTTVSVNSTNYSIAANSSVVVLVKNATQLLISASDLAVTANIVIDVNGSVANVALVNYKNLGGQVSVRVR